MSDLITRLEEAAEAQPLLLTLPPQPTALARLLREAAQAVVDRWDTPLWKEVEATAHVINRLRQALAQPADALERQAALIEALRTPPTGIGAVAWREALKAADDLVVTGTIYEDEALLADAETVKEFIAAQALRTPPAPMEADERERLEAELVEARTLDKGFYEWLIERDLIARGEEVEWGDIVVALIEHEIALCATHPPQPDALPGDLREKVAAVLYENIGASSWGGDAEVHGIPEATDAILSLIQSERGGA